MSALPDSSAPDEARPERRRLAAPISLQILGLLLGGLVAAQLATLVLSLAFPPPPPTQYGLDDIAHALMGEPVSAAGARPLVRSVQAGPPSQQSPGWVVSEHSRGELARRLNVAEADVRLLFYAPLPFAGVAPAPASAGRIAYAAPMAGGAGEPQPIAYAVPGGPSGFPGGGMGGGMGGGGFPGGMGGGGFPGGGFPSGSGGGSPSGGFPGGAGGRFPGGLPGGLPPTSTSRGGPSTDRPAPSRGPTSTPQGPGDSGRTTTTPAHAPTIDPNGPSTSAQPTAGLPSRPIQADTGGATPILRGPADAPVVRGAPVLDRGGTASGPVIMGPSPGGGVERSPLILLPEPTRPLPAPRPARTPAPLPRLEPAPQLARTPTVEPAPVVEAAETPRPTLDSTTPRLAAPAAAAATLAAAAPAPERLITPPMRRGLFGLTPAAFVEGDFVAAVRVGPGAWSVVSPKPEGFPNSWQQRLLLWFAISFGVVGPLGWLFAKRLAAPLDDFARAAERLGLDPSAPVLASGGPAEVGRAARAFNAMQARIRRYIDDRTAMMGAISHDLRTPLARMRFRIERAPPELQGVLRRDIEQMETMISSVLAFMRDSAESNQRERVDLRSILECVIDDAASTGGEVELEPGAPAEVEVDVLSVQRVFANLIDNALKYGENASVRLYVDADEAVTEIEDRGPGLPDEEIEQVFAPFYRAAKDRGSTRRGIGLGLAVSRSTVRAHGGDIRLQRAAGGGLVAQVRLPAPRRTA